jgi:ligand-binding sensor domain-containing protein
LYRILLAVFGLLSLARSFAQNTPSFLFTNYNRSNGLASNEVYKVQQDRAGYIWVATNNGLQRFDGIKFKNFRHEEGNSASLPSNIVHRMHIDKKDRLWLGLFHSTFVLFDKRRFTAKEIRVLTKKPTTLREAETRFIEDEEGRMFLSVRGNEAFLFDEKKEEFVNAASFLHIPESWGITTISQQPGTQKYWVGLGTGGLAIYNRKTGKLSYTGHNVENEPAIEVFGSKMGFAYSMFDKKGRFWYESWLGGSTCVQYDPDRKENPVKKFSLNNDLGTYYEVHNIMEQRNGRIWVNGPAVLAYYDDTADKFTVVPSTPGKAQAVVYEDAMAVYEDREENLWFGTRNDGLYRFNPSKQLFTNVAHTNRAGGPGRGTPMSFMQLLNGDILNGIWEDGVLRYSPQVKEVPLGIKPAGGQSLRDTYVWSMCASADSNTIWLGAQPGLGQIDQQQNRVHFRNPSILGNRTIRQVAEDKTGTLWLGLHSGGVYRWFNPKSKKRDSVVKLDITANCMVNKILVDRNGWVWVATGNNGLFVFEATSGRLIQHINGEKAKDPDQPGIGITGLADYNDSLVMVSDETKLYLFNRHTRRYRRHTVSGNILGSVAALQLDNDGYVWMSTGNALYRLHPFKKVAMMFDRRDGILSDQFVLSASYKLRDGRLLFANSNSFIAFDPAVAGATKPPPAVYITGLQIGRQEVSADSVLQLDQLQLDSKSNSITIDFSTLEYSVPYPIQYKIDGIDTDWKVADLANRITYPFLPVGRYTLQLRTYSPEGASAAVTKLKIRVLPPWYQTWWFLTLLGIALAFQLYWLDRQRNLRKRTLQKVRTDISDGLHQEINEALNNINILSEIARLKSEKEPQKAKEYLEQIHTKSHNMIIAMDDMLWSLDPENDSMNKTISRIKEYADALMQRHPVTIELFIDKNVERLQLNMKLRHETFLLFKEGIRSLVEAGTPVCIVHLSLEKAKLLFTIEFKNEGCNMQQLNNLLNRRDMEARLHALGAKLDVQLHKSRSMFLLHLPLG